MIDPNLLTAIYAALDDTRIAAPEGSDWRTLDGPRIFAAVAQSVINHANLVAAAGGSDAFAEELRRSMHTQADVAADLLMLALRARESAKEPAFVDALSRLTALLERLVSAWREAGSLAAWQQLGVHAAALQSISV